MRRNIWLFITSLVVGPAFGGLTFMLCAAISDSMSVPSSPGAAAASKAFFTDYWPLVFAASYTLGAIPGIIAAIIMAVVTRWLPALWQRLLAAAGIGAVTSVAVIGLFLLADGFRSVDDLMIAFAIMASGAVAGLACIAIVELFHPLPVPEKAAT